MGVVELLFAVVINTMEGKVHTAHICANSVGLRNPVCVYSGAEPVLEK
jgi:hypothetical protein